MIPTFEDFCLYTYVIVDDLYAALAPRRGLAGPAPRECSDSELLTMALVGECRGWDEETVLLSAWKDYPHLFPHLPSRTRCNRRRRNLQPVLTHLRQRLLRLLDWAHDRQCVIDSLPVPVMQFHLVPSSANAGWWRGFGAAFGKVVTKKQTIFGYKLHLLITANGVIRDFVLAPANAHDVTVAPDLLYAQRGLVVVGDSGYIGAPLAEDLWQRRDVALLVPPRGNQVAAMPPATRRRLGMVRQIVETVNDQLTAQLQIGKNHAHSFWGLTARLATKLTAHTLCMYLNQLMGNATCLQIKHLAFPI